MAKSSPWYVTYKRNPTARLRLFCFPYAGGAPPVFREWPEALTKAEIWIANLPGRGARWQEAPFTRMTPLVQVLTRELRPFLENDPRPFLFFGHSLGARLAFEVIRALRRQKRPLPQMLIASACAAPQLPFTRDPVHRLPKQALINELRRRNGTPAAVLENQELMELLLPAVRADFAVFETAVYASEPPLPLPITTFGGIHDPLVGFEALHAWQRQTQVDFQRQLFPGDHFFINSAATRVQTAVGAQMSPYT